MPMSGPIDNQVRRFATVVNRANLSGLGFQHLALCRRRAWFHLQRIDYAHLDASMQRGLALHEVYKPRDSSVEGLMGLAPDRIDWKGRKVFEAKGGAGAKDAVSRQGAFYALMLWMAQGVPWEAAAQILTQKRERSIPIDSTLVGEMVDAAFELEGLKNQLACPPTEPKPICDQCSYRFVCGYA